ncbi:uncharacterized protein [Acropora muricata]|uniref:uncharacterized protein isoform X3 n=1 Tax=Acropora muricata TaxID=159855 RepID=UPI0034E599EB
MVLTHLHIPLIYNYIVIVMPYTLYIEFTLIFTETIAYQCCNHTLSTNLKGEDSDSDCEENGDDLLPAFACTLQNVCSTFTEHEVQNGLEESDSCTVNTILPYVVRQNPSVAQRPATCHSDDNHSNPSSSGISEQRALCLVNTIQPYVVQQNPSVAQTPAACPSDNNHSNLYSNSDCIEQLTVMFPEMTCESLQSTLQAWYYDIHRAVTSILSNKEETEDSDDDDVPLSASLNVSPELMVKEFRDHMVDKYVPEQTIRASHDSNILRDMFRYLKSRQFNLRARPNVVFDGEDGMDAEGLTRELCHMMSSMRDGKGGIILFEGQIDHLIPVHNERCRMLRVRRHCIMRFITMTAYSSSSCKKA